jgi:hypothetical protein
MTGAKRVLLGIVLAVITLLVTAVGLAPARDRAVLWAWMTIASERASLAGYSADSIRRVIAAAEAGKAGRRCVEPQGSIALSGDVSAGSWTFYRHSWVRGAGKLWWRVARPSTDPSDTTLRVRAVLLDRPLPAGAESGSRSTRINLRPVERQGDTLVFSLHGPKGTTDFPSGVRVPSPGRWMFIATMGDNWGCFLYRL